MTQQLIEVGDPPNADAERILGSGLVFLSKTL